MREGGKCKGIMRTSFFDPHGRAVYSAPSSWVGLLTPSFSQRSGAARRRHVCSVMGFISRGLRPPAECLSLSSLPPSSPREVVPSKPWGGMQAAQSQRLRLGFLETFPLDHPVIWKSRLTFSCRWKTLASSPSLCSMARAYSARSGEDEPVQRRNPLLRSAQSALRRVFSSMSMMTVSN